MLELTEGFVNESGYDVTFDREFVRLVYLQAMDNPTACLIVDVDEDGNLNGGAFMETGQVWTKERWGFVQGFMVKPTRRGTVAARRLVEELVSYAKDAEISHVFASSTAAINPVITRQFVNLFSKFGFKEVGPVLMWER